MNLPKISTLAAAAILGFSAVNPAPANAGVANAAQAVDSTIIYLGVVPAALTRNHPGDRPGTLMHGQRPTNSIHSIHVMAAVFDRATGVRITNARVQARFLGERGRKWSVRLTPMTVNGALTYGAFTSMEADMNATIFIDVMRLGRRHMLTASFDYTHD